MARHEALRTRLVAGDDGRPIQVIDPPGHAELELIDLSALDHERRLGGAPAVHRHRGGRPFALSQAPLLRRWLLRLTAQEHILLVVVHHAVFDGWSAGVLLRDLAALYEAAAGGGQEETPGGGQPEAAGHRHQETPGGGQPEAAGHRQPGLAELPVQFADYALWERDRLTGTELAELEDYWREAMAGLQNVAVPHRPAAPAAG